MAQPALIVRIAQPCHEKWEAMLPTAAGRHCAACQKTVVDFTQKTDAEILAYFRQTSRAGTCGRFYKGQSGRPLVAALPAPRPAHWQLWLTGLLAAALTTQSCRPATIGEPQPRIMAAKPAALVSNQDSVVTGDSVNVEAYSARTVEGQVLAAVSRQPVPGVAVRLQHTATSVVTDAAGFFTIQLPDTLATPAHFVLHLAAAGYPAQTLTADEKNQPTKGLTVRLTSFPLPEMLLGEVEVLSNKKQ